MGKIVTLGEVVSDGYREPASSEVVMPFTARPGGAPGNVAAAAAKRRQFGAMRALPTRQELEQFMDTRADAPVSV